MEWHDKRGFMNNDNFSQDEINKFDTFAQDWWDPQGSMHPLHVLNPLRCDYVKHHAKLAQAKVLDVGCGAGLLSESLSKEGALVSAIDLSQEALHVAQTHAATQNLTIDYSHSTIEQFAEKHPDSFDVITCMEMLEHVPDPASVIAACAHAACPQAVLFFSTINRNPKAYLAAILGAEYILRLLPKGTHTYSKFIRPSELDAWARDAGLKLLDLAGISYNPLTQSAKLTSDASVNYVCCYIKEK